MFSRKIPDEDLGSGQFRGRASARRTATLGERGPFWIIFAGVLLVGTLVPLAGLCLLFQPPNFDGLRTKATVRLFARTGTACPSWRAILTRPRYGRRDIALRLSSPCVETESESTVIRDLQNGEVGLILDANFPAPGGSGEYRDGSKRVFIVIINPLTFNHLTLGHELCGHVAHGHTAIKAPYLLKPAVGFLLDLLLTPYEF